MAFWLPAKIPISASTAIMVKKAVRSIIQGQDEKTGYLGGSMYHHGFGMLALAESYGAVDDRNLWSDSDKSAAGKHRTIGQALELAVRCAVTSQKKNNFGGWRYTPDSTDADTSVSGAVLVGLLAARNAGIESPRSMHRQSRLLLPIDDFYLRPGRLRRRHRWLRRIDGPHLHRLPRLFAGPS